MGWVGRVGKPAGWVTLALRFHIKQTNLQLLAACAQTGLHVLLALAPWYIKKHCCWYTSLLGSYNDVDCLN